MTEENSQSEWSPLDAEISIQLRGRPMTPGVMKDIVSILKHVQEMEHIRKTYCPRCRDRAMKEVDLKHGFEDLDL